MGQWRLHLDIVDKLITYFLFVVTTHCSSPFETSLAAHFVGCEDGWLSYDNWCFYSSALHSVYEMRTFYDAQQQCREMGGELASIHNREENEYLGSTLPGEGVWQHLDSCVDLSAPHRAIGSGSLLPRKGLASPVLVRGSGSTLPHEVVWEHLSS